MAEYTNVSPRLIHVAGVMMVPGVKIEIPDEGVDNQGFQDLVDSGDVVAGDPPPLDEMQKRQNEREMARQEQVTKERQEAPEGGISVTRTTVTATATRPQQQQPLIPQPPIPQPPRRDA